MKDLPTAIDSLADSVRKNLSLSADVVEELKAQSFKPNTKSVEALREYDEGSVLMRAGKNLDALEASAGGDQSGSPISLWHFPSWRMRSPNWDFRAMPSSPPSAPPISPTTRICPCRRNT